MQKSYCYTPSVGVGARVGVRMQNVRANVKVLEFKSFCIFSFILIKPLTTKAYDRRASGDCGTSGYIVQVISMTHALGILYISSSLLTLVEQFLAYQDKYLESYCPIPGVSTPYYNFLPSYLDLAVTLKKFLTLTIPLEPEEVELYHFTCTFLGIIPFNMEDSNRCCVNANVHVRAFANCSLLSCHQFPGQKSCPDREQWFKSVTKCKSNRQFVIRIFCIRILVTWTYLLLLFTHGYHCWLCCFSDNS